MSVTIQTAVTANPPPCKHYIVTVDIDGGSQRVFRFNGDEVNDSITDDDVQSVLKAYLKYHRSRGQNIADPANVVGKTIFDEVFA